MSHIFIYLYFKAVSQILHHVIYALKKPSVIQTQKKTSALILI